MSRFIEILNHYRGEISILSLDTILQTMKERLEASCAHMELEFPYFIEKAAPVSGARSLMEYQCQMLGSVITSYSIHYTKLYEVTHAHHEKVPSDYIRKQTLKNAERYITPELKESYNFV